MTATLSHERSRNSRLVSEDVDYTIGICTWNRADQLARTLTQLQHLRIPKGVRWSVLVVDNNSTDHTADVLRQFESLLPLKHSFEPRQGKSYALNRAIRQIQSRWILWTDDDVLVPVDWLWVYHTATLSWPDFDFFGGPTVARFDGTPPSWIRKHWFELHFVYGERSCGESTFDIDEASLPWGANFAIRTRVQKTFCFDPRLGRSGKRRLGGEESELCRTLLRAGIKGKWIPDTRVEHCIENKALSVSFVARHYIGQGGTRARKRLLPLSARERIRQVVRLGRGLTKLGANWLARRPIDFLAAVDVCVNLGDLQESSLAYAKRLNRTAPQHTSGETTVDRTNLDAKDAAGRTALHHAAASNDVNRTVALLAAGANWQTQDNLGRTPLELGEVSLEFLHRVRQSIRRTTPSSLAADSSLPPTMQEHLQTLNRDGLTRVSGLLPKPLLVSLQQEFKTFISSLDARIARGEAHYRHYDEEEHWWEADQAYITNNAFKHCPTLAKLCSTPELVALTNAYLGDAAHITRAVGMRYLPISERSNDMFGWHHDIEDKRLKVMVLLTDVTSSDQPMSYALGTHRLHHSLSMFFTNHITLEHCAAELKQPITTRDTIGQAGDVFLFDSNGAHRGNRRPNASIRDALFVEYCTDTSDIWGADLNLSDDDSVRSNRQFDLIAAAPKKWKLRVGRSAPTWVETLPHHALWMPKSVISSDG